MSNKITYNTKVESRPGGIEGYVVTMPDVYGFFVFDTKIEKAKSESVEVLPILLNLNYHSQRRGLPKPKYECREGSDDFPVSIELSDIAELKHLQ